MEAVRDRLKRERGLYRDGLSSSIVWDAAKREARQAGFYDERLFATPKYEPYRTSELYWSTKTAK